MTETGITIETVGRRTYFRGETYPCRDVLKREGAHWDADGRAWWIGDRAKAEALAARLNASTASETGASGTGTGEGPQGDFTDHVLAGRATYKGKPYYVAGNVERGYGRYARDKVSIVYTRDFAKVLLISRDGTLRFWADNQLVTVEKRYERPQTINSLRDFKNDLREGRVRTCPNCGSSSCEGARGFHCEED